MDPALLAQVDARFSAVLAFLSEMVVIHGREIVFERYSGQSADVPIDAWSATKSVTNMAVGLAVAGGLLHLDQTVGELIPERIPAGADPRTATVTVEQLLTMTGGWAWDSTMPGQDLLYTGGSHRWPTRRVDSATRAR